MRLGRNDPCWCKSGKKYKKCHMAEDEQKQNHTSQNGRVMKKWMKNEEQIQGMRKACSFNAELMDYIRDFIIEGISTQKIDDLVKEYTLDHGYIPAPFKYRGYPKNCCVSVNEMVCHGIPSETIILKQGDIVNVDVTTIVDGYHGDQSESFLIGEVSDEAKKVVIAAANSMVKAIKIVKPGERFSKIGDVIEHYATGLGYSVVVDFTGHGIGQKFHEDPPIYHFKNKETHPFLMDAGMTFTVEPMINVGTWKVDVDRSDKWTVRTRDRKLSAQFEHTVLVTHSGCDILTLTNKQKQENKICLFSDIPENKLKII